MKTFTFYSYKGGVGRTLALVNVANRLVEFGKKVCILDFDLEAPGLQSKSIYVRQGMLTQVITGKNSHVSIGGTYSTQKTVTALISF